MGLNYYRNRSSFADNHVLTPYHIWYYLYSYPRLYSDASQRACISASVYRCVRNARYQKVLVWSHSDLIESFYIGTRTGIQNSESLEELMKDLIIKKLM